MPAGIDATQHPSTLAAVRDLVVLERHTLDDTETTALFDGDDEYALLLAVNEDSDETGVFTTDAAGNNATNVSGSNWGVSSGNNRINHDGTNYVVENQTGNNGQTYTIVGLTEV